MSRRWAGDERKAVFPVFLGLISVQQDHWVLHWAPCDKQLSSSLGRGVPRCWLPPWVMHAVSRHSLHPRNKAHSRLDYSYSTGFCFSSCALICKPLNKRHKAVCKIGSRVCCPLKPLGLPKPGFSCHHNGFFKAPSMKKLTTTTKMGGKGEKGKKFNPSSPVQKPVVPRNKDEVSIPWHFFGIPKYCSSPWHLISNTNDASYYV